MPRSEPRSKFSPAVVTVKSAADLLERHGAAITEIVAREGRLSEVSKNKLNLWMKVLARSLREAANLTEQPSIDAAKLRAVAKYVDENGIFMAAYEKVPLAAQLRDLIKTVHRELCSISDMLEE